MHRFIVLCVLVVPALCVTADGSVNSYVRRARSPYTYGEDRQGDHGSHGHGGSDGSGTGQSGFSTGQSGFSTGQSGLGTGQANTRSLLGQDGHGQQGYQGSHNHDHARGNQGNDNYLYKQHGY